jgi:hypothetical protein
MTGIPGGWLGRYGLFDYFAGFFPYLCPNNKIMQKVIRDLESIKRTMETLSYEKGSLVSLKEHIKRAVTLLISYQPKLIYSGDFGSLKTNPNKYIDPYLDNKSTGSLTLEEKINRSRKYAIEDIDLCINTLKTY